MRYFVTGATGFIGGHVVRQLCRAGHEVVALVRTPARAADLDGLGVTLHPGDVADCESMRLGMEGADGVFHIAGFYKIGARDRKLAQRINVEGTRNVLGLMCELRIPKGVYTSTVAVFSDTRGRLVDENYHFDGKHLTEYDRTKWLAHYEVALPLVRDGLPLVIIQPAVVYGPGDSSRVAETLRQYLRGKLWFVPARTAYCWAHVEDVARGHILAMEKGQAGQSYILAGPAHPLTEVLDFAAKITGIPAPWVRVPPAILRGAACLMKAVGSVVPLPEAIHHESLRAVAGVTYLADSGKAQRDLGFAARPLEEGLRETLRYEGERLGIRGE